VNFRSLTFSSGFRQFPRGTAVRSGGEEALQFAIRFDARKGLVPTYRALFARSNRAHCAANRFSRGQSGEEAVADDLGQEVFRSEKRFLNDSNVFFSGSLHQGDGMLIVYDVAAPDKTYEAAVETIHAMGEVGGFSVYRR
jgi:hypothetical protein